MVRADSVIVPRTTTYSGASPATQLFPYGTFALCGHAIPACSGQRCGSGMTGPSTPGRKRPGLGCSRFARRYSGNRCLFLLLRVLRCFSSPGSLSPAGVLLAEGVSPFGHPRVNASLRLVGAFRRSARPSSAPVPGHPPWTLVLLTSSSFSHLPEEVLLRCKFSHALRLSCCPPQLRLRKDTGSPHACQPPASTGPLRERRRPHGTLAPCRSTWCFLRV